MEPLLAVHTAIDPRTTKHNERIQRDFALARESHPSTGVEREEEQRFEAGVGRGGAFGDRDTQGKSEGIERSTFEWRDEEGVLASNEAKEAATEATRHATKEAARRGTTSDPIEGEGERVLGEVAAAEEAFPTPLTASSESPDHQRHKASRASPPSTAAEAVGEKSTVYRFVDTSGRGIFQPKDVQKAMQERDKAKAKKAKRRAARV